MTNQEWLEELRGSLVTKLLEEHNATENPRGLEFTCPHPEHEDSSPSAYLKDYAAGCMGCGRKWKLKDLAVLLDVPLPKGRSGYSLEDYAAEKSFSLEKLEKYGVHTAEYTSKRTENTLNVVAIPYYDLDGELIRHRYRTQNQKWWEGEGQQQTLYGLWMLANEKLADRPVLLVEGESDCHAAWHHGVLAIGVPGSSAWQESWGEFLEGREIFLWQEPGQGGKAFRQRIGKTYPKAKVLKAPEEIKDLAVLHMVEGENTPNVLSLMMQEALAADAPEPPVKIHAVGEAVLDDLAKNQAKPIDAIPTPFPSWNEKSLGSGGGHGLAKGWNIIVGAATGGFKSTLVGNIAAHGVRIGKRVGWLGLEEDKYENLLRFLPPLTGVEARKLYQGRYYDPREMQKAKTLYMEHFYRTGGTLLLPDKQIRGLDNVMDAYYYMVEVMGAEIMLVDYLQLAGDVAASESTLRKVAEISDKIRTASEDLNVVNISASQFKREGQQERPHRGMLMGGSPLENDSDQVLLLDHTRREHTTVNDGKGSRRVTDTWLLMDKNRHGPDGYDQDIPVRFDPHNRRMLEILPPEPSEKVPD